MDNFGIKLFLCGDVMTGRGIDQILPHPCDPEIHEPYMRNALGYVELAEQASGRIPRGVGPSYMWGDALAELDRLKPDLRIINLETAVTRSDEWLEKGINYRMHPENVSCLTAAKIDACALANNHVLDWGGEGLIETVETLRGAGIATAGAGRELAEAQAPAVLQARGSRVLVFSFADSSSGVPREWGAAEGSPGVDFIPELSDSAVERVAERIFSFKQPGDLVIASIHWGGNWGYEISQHEMHFAHALIDHAGVDLLHGHSSHHPKGIEIYRGKLVLYGCGDFINDYEGISGYEEYRGDLSLMYFPTLNARTGELERLELVPTQMKGFRVRRASQSDARWLASLIDRESRRLGMWIERRPDATFEAKWKTLTSASATDPARRRGSR